MQKIGLYLVLSTRHVSTACSATASCSCLFKHGCTISHGKKWSELLPNVEVLGQCTGSLFADHVAVYSSQGRSMLIAQPPLATPHDAPTAVADVHCCISPQACIYRQTIMQHSVFKSCTEVHIYLLLHVQESQQMSSFSSSAHVSQRPL